MRDASEGLTPSSTHRRAAPTVVVFTGGDVAGHDVVALVPDGAFVIAADSGLHTALDHHIDVDLAVGDFDSVSPDALDAAATSGTRLERHPTAKSETDLELALDRAVERSPDDIVVIGGHGGRLDHFLANAFLLASDRYRSARVRAHWDRARVYVVRDAVELHGQVGELLTLLPAHGPAHGVTTNGLLYSLDDATLDSGTTRGVSNQFLEPLAGVRLDRGVLLAIAPGELFASTDQPLIDRARSTR
jgi:thiamine pyrophosphokinase